MDLGASLRRDLRCLLCELGGGVIVWPCSVECLGFCPVVPGERELGTWFVFRVGIWRSSSLSELDALAEYSRGAIKELGEEAKRRAGSTGGSGRPGLVVK